MQYLHLRTNTSTLNEENRRSLFPRARIVIITIMAEMSKKEIRDFLMQGAFTGKLATVKSDGSSHVVPFGLY
jgi:hypothetical protein